MNSRPLHFAVVKPGLKLPTECPSEHSCCLALRSSLMPRVKCRSLRSPRTRANSVRVHAGQIIGPYTPIWNYFGADEPNYLYSPNGKKLLGELAALSPVAGVLRPTIC